MPRQNRVTPYGELIAVPDRGMFWGNRGVLLDRRGPPGPLLPRPGLGHLRAGVQGPAPAAVGAGPADRAVLPRRGHRAGGRAPAVRRVPLPGLPGVQARLGRPCASGAMCPGSRRSMRGCTPTGSSGPGVRRTYHAPLAGAAGRGHGRTSAATPWLVLRRRAAGLDPGRLPGAAELGPAATTVTVITPRATVAVLAAGYRPVAAPQRLERRGPTRRTSRARRGGTSRRGPWSAGRLPGRQPVRAQRGLPTGTGCR